MGQVTCVLVDVDGTLLAGPSSEALFAAYLMRHQRIGPRQFVEAAVFLARWASCFGRHVFKKNKAYLAGLAVDDVAALAEDFVRDELKPRLRPALLERIEAHRAAGHRIALLTGAPEFIARPLARHVGAELWSATRCVRYNGAFTADPPEAHPFFREKVARSLELCAAIGCELDDCVAYGNSVYDLPLLESVGRPIAVFPDRRLKRAARNGGWEILDA